MNPTAIYSKSGKGVQEASGKTSALSRPDRAVLSAIDGRATLGDVAQKCGKSFDAAFQHIIKQLDADGFIREVSGGSAAAAASKAGPSKPASKPSAAAAPTMPMDSGSDLDFSSMVTSPRVALPPKPPAPPAKPATPSPAPPPKAAAPVAPATKPAAPSAAMPAAAPLPPSKPAAPASEGRTVIDEQTESLNRARHEAEVRAQKERERIKGEAEARLRGEAEARLRAEAGTKGQGELEAKLRAEADAKVKAARDAALRATADAKAKADAERAKLEAERAAFEAERARAEADRKAQEEADRKAKEEIERARKEAEAKAQREAEALRKKLEEERARAEAERARAEAERKAREDAERKAKEEAARVAREAEEKAKREAEALRKQLEEERRQLEEERQRRDEEDKKRRQREDEERAARMKKEDAERKQREEADRKRRDDEESARREEQETRAARQAEENAERERAEKEHEKEQAKAAAPQPAPATGDLADSLLADLDSFGKREEEERKAKDEAERKAKADLERRAREDAERKAREDSERERRDAEERRRREEETRRAREEQDRAAREEEEHRKHEDEERKRKVREALDAAKRAQTSSAASAGAGLPGDDDIGVTDDDLDMDDVKQDERALSAQARRAARERERALEAKDEPVADAKPTKTRRPIKWGKPVAISLFVLLALGIGIVHVMPVQTAEYERAATEALGVPVRIGSGRLSLFTGVQLKFENVTAGDAKIAAVRAYPEIGSLFGPRKAFSRIELEGLAMAQSALGGALSAKAKGDNFQVGRVLVHKGRLEGPLALPPLDADIDLTAEGRLRSATVRGPEGLVAKVVPKDADLEIEVNASQFTLPIAPELTLGQFGMKGTASRQGMNITNWDGNILDGTAAGTATLRWGSNWSLEGAFTVRGMNAAVFAPALLSEGKADGTGKFSLSAAEPAKLISGGRIEGSFTINKGSLGSFDLSRAIQTGGRQVSGRTQFAELTGQGLYEKGTVSLRNIIIGAGALNAGASAEIAQTGALTGRIVADVKTATQTLRATLSLGGTVKDPQVKN